MQIHDLKIRLPSNAKAWLAVEAAKNGRTMNAEIKQMITAAMKDRPIFATVRRVEAFGDTFYAVTLGDDFGADAFFEGESKETALEAARAKLNELGFPRARIEFVEEKIG